MRVRVKGRSPRWASRVIGSRREVGEAEHLAGILGPAAQEGPQPGQQLGQGEGLDQVVVGSGVEALDPVVDGVAGGEHEHRGVVVGRPQAPAHVEPVDGGQADVEDHRVGRADGDLLQGLGPVGRPGRPRSPRGGGHG